MYQIHSHSKPCLEDWPGTPPHTHLLTWGTQYGSTHSVQGGESHSIHVITVCDRGHTICPPSSLVARSLRKTKSGRAGLVARSPRKTKSGRAGLVARSPRKTKSGRAGLEVTPSTCPLFTVLWGPGGPCCPSTVGGVQADFLWSPPQREQEWT